MQLGPRKLFMRRCFLARCRPPCQVARDPFACRRALSPSRRGTRVSRGLTPAWFTGARSCCGVKGVAHASVASWKCACRAGPAVGVAGPLGLAVALAGCATSSAGETSASRSQVQAERTDDGGRRPARAGRAYLGHPPAARRSERALQPQLRAQACRAPAGPPTRMSSAEEEALIARAITEHEMRRP